MEEEITKEELQKITPEMAVKVLEETVKGLQILKDALTETIEEAQKYISQIKKEYKM